MKILTNLDLAKNQLLNAVIQVLAQAPANPTEGQIYYDSVAKTLKNWDGTQWKVVGSEYTLPAATEDSLGGVKVGDGLAVAEDGTLSVEEISFDQITEKPTTLAGYGIIDAKIENGVITLGSATITPVVDANYKHITVGANSVSDGTTTIENIVSDDSYVHTDNNFTTAEKTKLTAIAVGDKSVTDGTNTLSNIVSDANYVHTDNNFTTVLKNKLDGIEESAQVNAIDAVDTDDFVIGTDKTLEVASGKQLMTTAQATKLANIAEGAEVNVNPDWNATSGDAQILNKPTTLAGYGITDAKIDSGVITLGEDEITPVVDASYVHTDNNFTTALKTKLEGIDLSQYLELAGGTMSGDIAMGSNKVTGLAAPTADGDAANKKFVEDKIAALGTVLNFVGTTTTEITEGSTVNPVTIDGQSYTAKAGDVVQYGSSEFAFTKNSKWTELGGVVDLTPYLRKDALAASTGTSEETTMTQKAITDALALKADQSEVDAIPVVKVATGLIGTAATSATVSFSGTFLSCHVLEGTSEVLADVVVGASSVTVTVAHAPASALTVSVVYME